LGEIGPVFFVFSWFGFLLSFGLHRDLGSLTNACRQHIHDTDSRTFFTIRKDRYFTLETHRTTHEVADRSRVSASYRLTALPLSLTSETAGAVKPTSFLGSLFTTALLRPKLSSTMLAGLAASQVERLIFS
jgi:hypothetical protein